MGEALVAYKIMIHNLRAWKGYLLLRLPTFKVNGSGLSQTHEDLEEMYLYSSLPLTTSNPLFEDMEWKSGLPYLSEPGLEKGAHN